jgi:hypothetical protein
MSCLLKPVLAVRSSRNEDMSSAQPLHYGGDEYIDNAGEAEQYTTFEYNIRKAVGSSLGFSADYYQLRQRAPESIHLPANKLSSILVIT